MGYKEREWYEGSTYHITARGNRRSDIFKDGEDFEIYLSHIDNAMAYYDGEYNLIAYCLMDNHVHLLIETKQRHIKDFITRIHSMYAKYFNHKHNYVGHLFQDRYFTENIENDSQMLETSRYIHLNPVKAKMVTLPEEYKYSSYDMFIGLKKELRVNTSPILTHFKGNRTKYKKFVQTL
ncbi:MAG: transposase [Clostridium sp.]